MYKEALQQTRKPRPGATIPGPIIHEGQPLDFSFLKMQDVTALPKERPRGGKRIAIVKDEEDEDAKKDTAAAVIDEKADGADAKEGKQITIVKNTAVPQVMQLLANCSISL